MRDDLQGGITTLRVSRDADSASLLDADSALFSSVILPVELDLSEWTQTLENRLEELTKRVDDTFKAIESRVKGLTGKFDALDSRLTISKSETKKRFDEIQTRFDQFESRMNDSRFEEETKLDELEKRINQQCACSDSSSGQMTTGSPSSTGSIEPPVATLRIPTFQPSNLFIAGLLKEGFSEHWTMIQRHNFLDKDAFNNRPWSDYKKGFSNGSNEFWLGLQRMHDQTKEGSWNLKVQVTYDLGKDQRPSPRHGKTGVYEWEHFIVKSERDKFALGIGKQIQGQDEEHKNDPMSRHNGKPFATEDKWFKWYQNGCTQDYKAGWWYSNCFDICPNCLRDRAIQKGTGLLYDGEYEYPSESIMWMKRVD